MNSRDSLVRKKAELQSWGIRVPGELIDILEAEYNAPAIRTGRIVLCLESPQKVGELIPVFIVNGKRVDKSPLHMVQNDAHGFEIWAGDKKYTDITMLSRPRFYGRYTASGIPMYKLAVLVAPGHVRFVVSQRCYYYEVGKACRFCAVHNWWDANVEKASAEIADVVVAGVEEGLVQHVSLTTATLGTPGKGLEGLVKTAQLMRERAKVPVMFEFEPLTDISLLTSLLHQARESGVTTVSCNIECFDEDLRPIVMPAKGKIPVANYVRTWEKCLEIFGQNEVFTTAVIGIGESDDSILAGVEMAASHGVMTFLVPHSPAIGAVYEDMEAPSADRVLSLYDRAVAIYERYGLDICACRAGCVRGSGFSAIKDMARFGA